MINKDENYNKINEYYNKFSEDKRLTRRHGIVEFVISMYFITKYLKPNSSVLDIGSGTGRYTFELANLGHNVSSVEYTKSNFKALESNYNKFINSEYDLIKELPKYINVVPSQTKGQVELFNLDARDLALLGNKKYDAIIIFGPMYHLSNLDDQLLVINNAIDHLNSNGHIFISYILNYYAILKHGFIDNNIIADRNNIDDNYHIIPNNLDLYNYWTLEDINNINAISNLKSVERFSQEGPSDYIRSVLNDMDEKTFDEYIKWNLSNCNKEYLLGNGTHIVDVVEK